MQKQMMGIVLLVGLMVAGPGWAFAASEEWQNVGGFLVVGPDAVGVKVDRPSVSLIRIVCIEGSVIIKTVVVREGGSNTSHTVGKRIENGNFEVIEIRETKVTGLQFRHDGRGSYRVQVK
ncbi:MAG: hypothetical protein V1929_04285 [bacterium]